jgi:hypothetical protein
VARCAEKNQSETTWEQRTVEQSETLVHASSALYRALANTMKNPVRIDGTEAETEPGTSGI